MGKPVERVLQVFALVCVGFVVFVPLVVRVLPITMGGQLLLMLTGKSAGCSLSEVWSAPKRRICRDKRTMEIRRGSTLLRSDGRLQQWSTEDGLYWVPKGTDLPFLIAEQEDGAYDGATVSVQAGDVVLDGGANVGTFVRHALSRGADHVIAVEPVPDNVASLERTFAREIAKGHVTIYPKGIWERDGEFTMYLYENSALDSFVLQDRWESQGGARAVTLPLTTIDRIVSELDLDRLDFIKMDIEGAERQALRGALTTIRRFHPRMALATENLADDWKEIPLLIEQLSPGYEVEGGACIFSQEPAIRREVVFFH
jgi:FkbM family methyltransferase